MNGQGSTFAFSHMKKSPWFLVILLLIGLFAAYQEGNFSRSAPDSSANRSADNATLLAAYHNRQSNVQRRSDRILRGI